MIGKKIHNYEIKSILGEGGMAIVYEGVHEKLRNKVAIKVLNPILAANKQIRERFEDDAKFMASLQHKNIVKVLDYCEHSGSLSIIMELLVGQDLNSYIKKHGAINPEQALPLFVQILDSFSYIHENGIVHRDMKPSNIFVETNGNLKILDFGIAKLFGTGEDRTRTGTQMGTPVYMSPEQVKGEKSIDFRSDIYSLGVTLYFILTGKSPYDITTQSDFEIFNKIVFEELPELIKYPEINSVLKKATAKDCNLRFQDMESFKIALHKAVIGSRAVVTKDVNKAGIVVLGDANKNLKPNPNEESTIVENKYLNETIEVESRNSKISQSSNLFSAKKIFLIFIGVLSLIIIGVSVSQNNENDTTVERVFIIADSVRIADSTTAAEAEASRVADSVNAAAAEASRAADSFAATAADEAIRVANPAIRHGGIVFYEENGHGLVAAITDLGVMDWNTAKTACDELVLNGYSDWHLPTQDELNSLYVNFKKVGVGGFVDVYYWSSTYSNNNSAWIQNFINGEQYNANENGAFSVRSVRAF